MSSIKQTVISLVLGVAIMMGTSITAPYAAEDATKAKSAAASEKNGAKAQKASKAVFQKPTADQDAKRLLLAVGKAEYINLPRSARDVIVANPKVADAIVKSPRKVYLIGKQLGTTNVFFVDNRGQVIEHVIVGVQVDVELARRALVELLPDTQIDLKAVNDSIVIRGTVRSPQEAANAAAVTRRFVSGDTKVINMIRVVEDQQVLLQVRVAEIQRNALKNLGISTRFRRTIHNNARLLDIEGIGGEVLNAAAEGTVSFNYLGFVDASFTTLERQGLVKTLAEPTLTAISGETADFLAGGQFPVPAGIDNDGNLIIEFRDFGVKLEFTPTVLADRNISLKIKTEVSRQAEENSLVLPIRGGDETVDVIGFSVRRAASTVTLPSGGSMMIAGLIQKDDFNQINGVPGINNLPVIGALFRSPSFQSAQSELVVIVRSFLVRPTEPQQRLSLPTDGFMPADDIDIYLIGRLHKRYGDPTDEQEVPELKGPYGYIME